MKIDMLTSFFKGKKSTAALEAAVKIEKLSYKLMGFNSPDENKSRDINDILKNSYKLLETLDNKLEEESKNKKKDYFKKIFINNTYANRCFNVLHCALCPKLR